MIGRDILGIEDLSREDIETILETAEQMRSNSDPAQAQLTSR